VDPLVSNGWDGFGTDSREIDCIVAFFVNLTDEDDHVTFDEVEPQGYLLDALIRAVNAFFGIGEDDVRFLVIACEDADDGASILEDEENATVYVAL